MYSKDLEEKIRKEVIKELNLDTDPNPDVYQYFQKASGIADTSNNVLKMVIKLSNNDFEQAKFALDLALIKLRVLVEYEKASKRQERDKERKDREDQKTDAINTRDSKLDKRHQEKMNFFKNNTGDQ